MFNNLIFLLIAIDNFSKDIHYTSHGEAFYAKHLLVDKFNFSDYIDIIKETCLLGRGDRPLSSKEYLFKASELLEKPEEHNDKKNFQTLQNLIEQALRLIQSMEDTTKADDNIIGNIAQDLQQYYGLLNLQVEE